MQDDEVGTPHLVGSVPIERQHHTHSADTYRLLTGRRRCAWRIQTVSSNPRKSVSGFPSGIASKRTS
ncbi:MAG: hypothetical protein E5X68_02735 [Mesorhizobium sp.]|nr:MAG: hypothetical protein EOQ84_09690 [Mesorhizobium sp.]RWL34608.1 MAG: hypothetical protein EOR58_02315 [Mesorhizobium sp.]RWL36021.1 MAG: hypothetical protein EOR63_04895 [Mesorhizobium sp.]RWL41432.1 MAG: hypothetical protein EOR59_02320 [Mesorhizobium sp.]RWL49630.1 MAG: hypothetical protein EOR62_25090 [Mesorhizobium sp.]